MRKEKNRDMEEEEEEEERKEGDCSTLYRFVTSNWIEKNVDVKLSPLTYMPPVIDYLSF